MIDYVCANCFADAGLRDFVDANAEEFHCDFCDDKSEDIISIPVDRLLGYIRESIEKEYDDAANWLPYESKEGGYLGTTYDGYDLIFEEIGLELPRDKDGRLFDTIANFLTDRVWCDTNPYGLSIGQLATYSWTSFAEIVKHKRRFYFSSGIETQVADERLTPGELLDRVFAYAEEMGLIKKIEAGEVLYRARRQEFEGPWESPADLGPPKASQALQSNRMSPAGIVMFYGSSSIETALRETVSGAGDYSVGHFQTTRDSVLLDISNLPSVPSLFEYVPDSAEVDPRRANIFLRNIAWEISQPIARDDRVHVEYAPTQVFSEFIRTRTTFDDVSIDGILFASSVSPGNNSYVLFATRDNVHGITGDAAEAILGEPEKWLKLEAVSHLPISESEIGSWKAEAVADIAV